MYEKAIKKRPTANLQRLQQHNRQQPLPASHTSLAWGVTGASLYQSHTAMFTIAPTMQCQLPQCKERDECQGLEGRQRRRYEKYEVCAIDKKILCASNFSSRSQKSSFLWRQELQKPVYNLHCTSTKHLLGLECH